MKRIIRPPTLDELIEQAPFESLEHIVASIFEEMRPAGRMSVTAAAEKYVRIGSGGGHSKPWSKATTPYLEEPPRPPHSLG